MNNADVGLVGWNTMWTYRYLPTTQETSIDLFTTM
jgi:hypothetical protein